MQAYNHKPIPQSILIFGAEAHIGRPLANFLSQHAADIQLRLATYNPQAKQSLEAEFPKAEVVIADYSDLASLQKAVAKQQGIFVITPGGMDEEIAMTNLVTALADSPDLIHLVRQLGMQPEYNPHRLPETISSERLSLPMQHPRAKKILDDSGLPVTYVNCGATFIDNFLIYGMLKYIDQVATLTWPERLIPWLDPRDVAEVVGRLLLSDNHRHIGQFHTLNNGQDLMRFHQATALMAEVLGIEIRYDSSKEGFFAAYSMLGPQREVLWNFLQYEQNNEVVWALNDFVSRTIGRRPTSLREWLVEHREQLLASLQR